MYIVFVANKLSAIVYEIILKRGKFFLSDYVFGQNNIKPRGNGDTKQYPWQLNFIQPLSLRYFACVSFKQIIRGR